MAVGSWGRALATLLALGSFGAASAQAQDAAPAAPKPIRALLVTGGPFHNYKRQQRTLLDAMATRANVEWTVVFEEKQETGYKIPLFEKPGWADGFDVVVHNECFADVDDPAYVARLVAVHKAGVPAVVVHCAMHTFRGMKSDEWREFLGVTTVRHGAQRPLVVRNDRPDHPIMKGFPASWTTGPEELYQIDKLWPESVALASAEDTNKRIYPVFWTHQYGQARVFGTTLPHNQRTIADPVFLDLFGRGLLWAAGRLGEDGKPAPGAESPRAAFVVPGVEPRAADADAPLAEGWPAATRPGAIEVKAYPAYRGAVARGQGAALGGEAALFTPLFLHITREKIAMTAPVVSPLDPATLAAPGATGAVGMEFVYRTPTTGAAGRGLGAVTVEDRPAATFASLGVQGDDDPARIARGVAVLRAWLAARPEEWVADGPPRTLGYHPPSVDRATRLWEVQLPVRRADAAPEPR